MSIVKTLFNISRTIPETDEVDWGDQMTLLLDDICDALDQICGLSAGGLGVPRLKSSTSVLAAAATLTVTTPCHKISGNGGAVTLSGATSIADGDVADQIVLLQGNHATNTVTIQDATNTRLNGNITLAIGDSILLRWDSTDSNWWEISRSV